MKPKKPRDPWYGVNPPREPGPDYLARVREAASIIERAGEGMVLGGALDSDVPRFPRTTRRRLQKRATP